MYENKILRVPKMINMKKTIIITSLFFMVTCKIDKNPVIDSVSNGETCEGQNGTLSESGRWQEFNTSNSCLPSNTIRCLEVDHNNNLWIGTDNGLVFYNSTKWIIYNTSNSKLPFNVILSLACEEDTVWVGGGGTLAKFNSRNWTIYNSTNSPLGNPPAIIGPTILTLKVDSKHNIWMGTNYYGLYKFDKINWTRYVPTFGNSISSTSIASIDIEVQDIVWVGHFEQGGVDRFDGSNWLNYTPENSPLPYWDVTDVHVDKMNLKWFATSFGLAGFDGINWTVYDTTNYNIQDEIIYAISSDSKNNLWIGSFSGALLTRNNSEWNAHFINDSSKPAIPYNTINCLEVDRFDNKWIGTQDNGLYLFNENGIKK
jgi:ligand-binding sensor domain-containing protein